MVAPPSPAPAADGGFGLGPKLGSLERYALAVGITAFAILSQYFLPQAMPPLRLVYGSFVGDLVVIYGVPVLAFLVLVGAGPLRRAFVAPVRSAVEGFRWYGLLSLLSILILIALVALYAELDPAALKFLMRTNPAIRAAQSDPWFWVAFSFVIGVVEEVIFRGWIFGYWLARGTRSWFFHAAWTSALFAGVHLYYGLTYGPAAPLLYTELFLLGLAFAGAVRYSGGNLVWVAFLHGFNDASSFLSIVNGNASLALHYGIILLGGLIGLIYWLRSRSTARARRDSPLPPGSFPEVADPYRFMATGTMAPPPPSPGPLPPPPTEPPDRAR